MIELQKLFICQNTDEGVLDSLCLTRQMTQQSANRFEISEYYN